MARPASDKLQGSSATQAPRGRRQSAGTSERARRRDAEVLAAATKVFYTKSYADSSVQDVADELGILKGSLYHYIKTKEDLLVWLVEDVHDDVAKLIASVQAVDDLAPLERLELYLRKQVAYNAANIPRITVYHHDSDQLSAEPRKALRTRQRTNEQWVIGLIEEAQARGDVSPDFDSRVMANSVFATVIWIYRWYKPSGRLKADALADHCVEFALAGLRGAGRR